MANENADLESIKSALREQDEGWEAGPTSVLGLPAEERQLHLGAVLPEDEPSWNAREQSARTARTARAVADTPAAVDLRQDGFITPVQDQGSCGSCVAFGSVAAIEGTARLRAENASLTIDLSEAHLFYCHAAAQNRRCSTGWWVDPALICCRDLGLVGEPEYPYVAGDQRCAVSGTASPYVIDSYEKMRDVGKMKHWLATKGPLIACFLVYEDFYAYKSGVYRHVTGREEGGHCVCIVGYDDASNAWIAKNSWGEDWGEQGFFHMAYGECGIDFEMWGVTVPAATEEGTWLNACNITGLWIDTDSSGAAAYVADDGWKHIEEGSARDSLLALLGAARASGALVDLRVVDDAIREIYVW